MLCNGLQGVIPLVDENMGSNEVQIFCYCIPKG